jgi:hypothetical protein
MARKSNRKILGFMDCINILDAKQAIIKLLKDYDRNNRKERCSDVLVKNSNKRFYPTALRVTLSPNVEDDAESVIVDVVCLILNNREEPQFSRYTLGTTISELCANCKDTSKLERWLCNDKSNGFTFPKKDLIIEDSTVTSFSKDDVITAFDKIDEFYQTLISDNVGESDAKDFELSADDIQSLVNDISNELTK